MAFETVLSQQDPFSSCSYPYDEHFHPYGFGFGPEYDPTGIQTPPDRTETDVAVRDKSLAGYPSSPENFISGPGMSPAAAVARRRRRRTATVAKNKEEVESQRMVHIATERNRRKQMNEYLSVLRSMMPPSYVHRGDQASIIGGAVNFVKELEHLLQSLKAAQRKEPRINTATVTGSLSSSLFADFFTFPQYSTDPTRYAGTSATTAMAGLERPVLAAIADVEVTVVEGHASVKVLSRKRPKQLVKMVVGLQSHCLSILHLNVTTVDDMVLYTFSVKAEDECQLRSVNEIAAAVYEMVGRIQEEAKLS